MGYTSETAQSELAKAVGAGAKSGSKGAVAKGAGALASGAKGAAKQPKKKLMRKLTKMPDKGMTRNQMLQSKAKSWAATKVKPKGPNTSYRK